MKQNDMMALLENKRLQAEHDDEPMTAESLTQAIDQLRWRSVEERPDSDDEIDINFGERFGVCVGKYIELIDEWRMVGSSNRWNDIVIGWKPRPQPPQEG